MALEARWQWPEMTCLGEALSTPALRFFRKPSSSSTSTTLRGRAGRGDSRGRLSGHG
jgi:hypothetical protein